MKKQPTQEPEALRRPIVQTKKLRHDHMAAKNAFHRAATNVGQDISDIIEALPFYVLLVDEHHYILHANGAVRRHLGLEPKDILGKYCPKVVHGTDKPFYACPLEEAVEKDQAVEREVVDVKSGRWIRSAIYPTRKLTHDGRKIFFHMISDITDRKQAMEQLEASRDRLRSLSMHLESVREEERRRIARELHDETSQVVAGLTANLQTALDMLPTDANKTKGILRNAQSMSINLLDQIHRLIYELRPALLDDFGLAAATKLLLADPNLEKAGIAVNFKSRGQAKRLSPQLETTLFRVIQEALSNVAKHSHAKHTKVSLYFKGRVVIINVKDDGIGFDVEEAINSKDRPRGLGLLGMKERVELINGTLDIRSEPGIIGTEIDIRIPLD